MILLPVPDIENGVQTLRDFPLRIDSGVLLYSEQQSGTVVFECYKVKEASETVKVNFITQFSLEGKAKFSLDPVVPWSVWKRRKVMQ